MPIVLLVCHVVATVAALPGQKMIQNEEDKSLQQRRARLLCCRSTLFEFSVVIDLFFAKIFLLDLCNHLRR